MLKLLLYPILLLILLITNTANNTTILTIIILSILFFYITDFIFKNKKDPFEVQSKPLTLLIAALFLTSILYSIYYIWIR